MQPLGALDEAHRKVLQDTRDCLSLIHRISAQSCDTVLLGIALLDQLRQEVYEDLNQIQHEHLIVCAARWLQAKVPASRTSSGAGIPDTPATSPNPIFAARAMELIVLSAEVTTSERPVGTIEARMKITLAKLARMQGTKYYFVRTTEMAQRATTKVNKAGWPILVVNLGNSGAA